MRLSTFDLNLLLAFEALMEERSVSRAAKRMAVSQSAMSHTLARLRKALGDPLFVRTPRGIRPTPRALSLIGPVRDSLHHIDEALTGQIDVAKVERTFTILTNAALEYILFPALLERFGREAPLVNLRSVHPRSKDVGEELEREAADVAILRTNALPDSIRSRTLFRSRQVCLVRRDHSLVGDTITAAQFAKLGHVEINRWGSGEISWVDRWMAEHGLKRRVVATTTTLLAIPSLLVETDLVATLGQGVAERLAAIYPLRVVEPPFGRPHYRVSLAWHRRDDRDPMHRWFREQIGGVARDLVSGATR